ncbi:MAG: hypothetical protein LRY63_01500 [Nitrincola sp.]|nr:hypothetical protein [Nitrincola sp.]
MKNDIRERVHLVSIVPMLLITLILGLFFTYNQIKIAKQSMVEKGQEFSKLLSAASEFGILSNNPAELSPLSQQLMDNPLVIDVIFMDQDFVIIHREDDFDITLSIPPASITQTHDAWCLLNR